MSMKRLFPVLRLIFSLAVAAWAINYVVSKAGANLTEEFRNCNWGWLSMTIVFTAIGTAISSYRWSRLLALQQVVVTQWDAFRLSMIGVFFNLFGLGGVGGDIFKAYYVRAHAGDRKNEAMLSIVVDRILGLLGLFLVALASLPFVWSELRVAPRSIQSMVGFVVLISLVGGGGVTLVLTRDAWMPAGAKKLLLWGARMFPPKLVELIAKLIFSVDLYRAQLPQLLGALGLSAVVHTMATMGVVCVGQAFHVSGIPLRFYFLGIQVANTISAVPITPSGLGSRDLVLSAFLKFGGGGERCDLIPFGLSCTIVLWSLVGGIFFVMAKRSGDVPPELEEEESQS